MPEDLDNVRNDLTGSYILMNDIDLSEWGTWVSIGTLKAPFTGVFDGNGYAIKNISNLFGFFATSSALFSLLQNASVLNLGMVNCAVSSLAYSDAYDGNGAVASVAESSFIFNCYNTGDVRGVALSGNSFVLTFATTGGIVGKAKDSFISNCYNIGAISVFSDNFYNSAMVGGIVGYAQNTRIFNCYNTGAIEGYGTTINSPDGIIGGIQGAGGIVGSISYSEDFDEIIISNCYSAGVVSSYSLGHYIDHLYPFSAATPIPIPEKSIGAIAGSFSSPDKFENCYYLSSNGVKAFGGQYDSFDASPLTDEEMREQSSFVGFDFDNVWAMPDDGGYPVFKSMVYTSDPDPGADPTPTPCSNNWLTQWLNNFIKSIMRALISLLTFGLL